MSGTDLSIAPAARRSDASTHGASPIYDALVGELGDPTESTPAVKGGKAARGSRGK
ncbi:hypothetical protein [Cellulomonas chengniuliangii]|uniref:Uncharacterized protein n=1 Tax=Cellulomonas chengniuliangii TaxID=2968084 RepID=A0ABY5L191_9CELL|nr:hypothetical protein [Cellulomonas chengniuliangii]MCC2308152.1 hypothetical protein [Cellulomonas chengniuliangii]MCC2317159.1 hypothetical protein [Cellulomonas chengniuliangii]UUI76546.1 hypothetical protein NP064_06570 [Cellulomonas chengniuliangii]